MEIAPHTTLSQLFTNFVKKLRLRFNFKIRSERDLTSNITRHSCIMSVELVLNNFIMLPVVSRGCRVVSGSAVVVGTCRRVTGYVGLSTTVVAVTVCRVSGWRLDVGWLTLRCSQTRRQPSTVKNLFALPLQPPYVNWRQLSDDAS